MLRSARALAFSTHKERTGKWFLLTAGFGTTVALIASSSGDGFSSGLRGTAAYRALVDRVGVPMMRRLFDAESAHNWTLWTMKLGFAPREAPSVEEDDECFQLLSTRVFGLNFRCPLGMAAGFDKQAEVMGELLEIGFGFVEVGSEIFNFYVCACGSNVLCVVSPTHDPTPRSTHCEHPSQHDVTALHVVHTSTVTPRRHNTTVNCTRHSTPCSCYTLSTLTPSSQNDMICSHSVTDCNCTSTPDS